MSLSFRTIKSRFALSAVSVCLLACLSFSLAQAPIVIQTNVNIMLGAVQSGLYGSFVSAGSDEFKASYTQESFNVLREQNAIRLEQGFEATYLTSINSKGFVVFLWKLTYNDGSDDSLLSLSVQNGFVVGFRIQ